LKIASILAKPTLILMFILSPLGYPISLILDCLLGHWELSWFSNTDL